MIKKRIFFSILATIIFTSNFLHAMDPALHQRRSGTLIVETSDGQKFEADRSLCMQSNTIKNFLEDFEDQEASKKEAGKEAALSPVVPLPGVTGQEWCKTYEFLQKYNLDETGYLRTQTLGTLSRQLRTLNYLDISPIKDTVQPATELIVDNILERLRYQTCGSFFTNRDFLKNIGLDEEQMPSIILNDLKNRLIKLREQSLSHAVLYIAMSDGSSRRCSGILSQELEKCKWQNSSLERILFLINLDFVLHGRTAVHILDLNASRWLRPYFDQLNDDLKSWLIESGFVKLPWHENICYWLSKKGRSLWNEKKKSIISTAATVLGAGLGAIVLYKYKPNFVTSVIECSRGIGEDLCDCGRGVSQALCTFRRKHPIFTGTIASYLIFNHCLLPLNSWIRPRLMNAAIETTNQPALC